MHSLQSMRLWATPRQQLLWLQGHQLLLLPRQRCKRLCSRVMPPSLRIWLPQQTPSWTRHLPSVPLWQLCKRPCTMEKLPSLLRVQLGSRHWPLSLLQVMPQQPGRSLHSCRQRSCISRASSP